MNKRVWKVAGWGAALATLLLLGAAIGGGVVFALTGDDEATSGAIIQAQQAEAEPGLLISSVLPDTPAAEAGLARGDILLKIDDTTVNQVIDLRRYLADLAVGDPVAETSQEPRPSLQVFRQSQRLGSDILGSGRSASPYVNDVS